MVVNSVAAIVEIQGAILEKYLIKFVLSSVITGGILITLGLLVLFPQEYGIWAIIIFFLSLLAGVIGMVIPSNKQEVYVSMAFLVAFGIAYLMFSSY